MQRCGSGGHSCKGQGKERSANPPTIYPLPHRALRAAVIQAHPVFPFTHRRPRWRPRCLLFPLLSITSNDTTFWGFLSFPATPNPKSLIIHSGKEKRKLKTVSTLVQNWDVNKCEGWQEITSSLSQSTLPRYFLVLPHQWHKHGQVWELLNPISPGATEPWKECQLLWPNELLLTPPQD